MALRFTGHDDVGQFLSPSNQVGEFSIEFLGNNQQPRPAVLEHETVFVFGQERVDGHRHHAGIDGPEERRRPIDGVERAEADALLAANAERTQHVTETLGAFGESPYVRPWR